MALRGWRLSCFRLNPKAKRSSLRAVGSYELEANLMPLKVTPSITNRQSKVVL
jgi:hypothetical protein